MNMVSLLSHETEAQLRSSVNNKDTIELLKLVQLY